MLGVTLLVWADREPSSYKRVCVLRTPAEETTTWVSLRKATDPSKPSRDHRVQRAKSQTLYQTRHLRRENPVPSERWVTADAFCKAEQSLHPEEALFLRKPPAHQEWDTHLLVSPGVGALP